MKINSSPYTFEKIFPTNQNKKPRKAFKIIQNLKVQLIKINKIQKPGNCKKQETKENPKRIFFHYKSTGTCKQIRIK